MSETCLLFYQNLDDSFDKWSNLSTVELELAALETASSELVDKRIDESISYFALSLTEPPLAALAIFGLFSNLDAATLLGTAQAGEDEAWIEKCKELRDLIKTVRQLKANKAKLVQVLKIPFAKELMAILQQAAKRNTKVFLIGDLAIALGFLAIRSNSKAKDFLIPATKPKFSSIEKVISSTDFSKIVLPENASDAKSLAITLLSHV